MEINATLIIQMLVFLVFVWFTMKFVWPPLMKALEERQDKIAEGLAQAERGRKDLALAHERIKEEMKQAKEDAAEIIEKATQRANLLIDESKEQAKQEASRIMKSHEAALAQEVNRARETLQRDVSLLAVAAAEKIMKSEIDEAKHQVLIDDMIEEL